VPITVSKFICRDSLYGLNNEIAHAARSGWRCDTASLKLVGKEFVVGITTEVDFVFEIMGNLADMARQGAQAFFDNNKGSLHTAGFRGMENEKVALLESGERYAACAMFNEGRFTHYDKEFRLVLCRKESGDDPFLAVVKYPWTPIRPGFDAVYQP
jgi:hypothetical protein